MEFGEIKGEGNSLSRLGKQHGYRGGFRKSRDMAEVRDVVKKKKNETEKGK